MSGTFAGIKVDILNGLLPRLGKTQALFERSGFDGYGDIDLGQNGRSTVLTIRHWSQNPDSFLNSLMAKQGDRPVAITTSRGESNGMLHVINVIPVNVQRAEHEGSNTFEIVVQATVRRLSD